MFGFFDITDAMVLHSDDYCTSYYYHDSYSYSFAPTAFQLWTEFTNTMGINININVDIDIDSMLPITATITTIDVLRFFLFLSVVLFLCTAVLLQGTLLQLGMVRCRRTLEGWNAMLTNASRRLV